MKDARIRSRPDILSAIEALKEEAPEAYRPIDRVVAPMVPGRNCHEGRQDQACSHRRRVNLHGRCQCRTGTTIGTWDDKAGTSGKADMGCERLRQRPNVCLGSHER
jgi:hypothetical protein